MDKKLQIFWSIIVGVISLLTVLQGFNLSPKPNFVFLEPNLKTYLPKERSSYFGFSLNLRQQSLIIGAPRSQSTLESQRKVNETGAIYKCGIKTQKCEPYIFDELGNTIVENSEHTYDSEMKDNQWLGAAIDGGSKENDRLVVCAPRLIAHLPKDYLLHGICYWIPNTNDNGRPTRVKKIAPLRLKTKQLKQANGGRYYYHMFGEEGISVHVSENNEEIIIGTPGLHTWKGSIIRYYATLQEDIGLSRRDNSHNGGGISKRDTLEYVSEIPNPELWEQANDSYFGYAVSSGFFEGLKSKKLMYLATAPQANDQKGEAYLFEVINSPYGEQTIRKHHTFSGDQFGEFFGYAVISEDINGDGLTDVIISAPMRKIGTSYDNGVIYVFINKGSLDFENGKKHFSGSLVMASRFGATLTKLGDVNRDGYNDIAVGAPFEGNGTVYIFLGGPRGLPDKPSQILTAPNLPVAGPHMFGHGLSKGSDIDDNSYNDFAVGAPNADAVYLYRSYPVVKIVAYIKSLTREIKIDQNKIQIQVCWKLEYNSAKEIPHNIKIRLVTDPQLKRAFFSENLYEKEIRPQATSQNQCNIFDVMVRFSTETIFRPIIIEMHYELVKKIPNSEVFCDDCAAIDPLDPILTSEKIAFSTGCKKEICVADLKLKTQAAPTSYILGSSKTLSIVYDIINAGETSYLTQINVTSSSQLPFAKIPSNCKLFDAALICNILNGQPMSNGDRDTFTVDFDVSQLDDTSLIIFANVFSTGDEANAADNTIDVIVELKEFSEIEAVGRTLTPVLNLDEGLRKTSVSNVFEIRNHGPSTIKEMNIILSIPVSYQIPNTDMRIALIDFGDVQVNASYHSKNLDISFTQNNTILIPDNDLEVSTGIPLDNMQGMDFDSSKLGYPLEVDDSNQNQPNDDGFYNNIMARRRREIDSKIYLQHYTHINQRRNAMVTPIIGGLAATLPTNRTIFFNCNDPEETLCIQATLTVHNFVPGDSLVKITTQYTLDLEQVDKILQETKDFFVLTTMLDFVKIGDEERKTLNVAETLPHNIVSKHQLHITPIWVYVVSVIGGLLALILISYALYKFGFFKREKKEELEKLHRQSQRITNDDSDDE